MKLAFCSEFDADEIHWTHASQIPLPKAIQMQARPTKAVLGVILLLEQGKFPVVKVNPITDYPVKESWITQEAYVRCHMSVIPVIFEDEVRVDNANPDDSPVAQREPDGEDPF